jgi:hypothetical protein
MSKINKCLDNYYSSFLEDSDSEYMCDQDHNDECNYNYELYYDEDSIDDVKQYDHEHESADEDEDEKIYFDYYDSDDDEYSDELKNKYEKGLDV